MTPFVGLIMQEHFSRSDLVTLLSATEPDHVRVIQEAAEAVLLEHCGSEVYFRGLIESSNLCVCDCHYCGIRRSSKAITRYELTVEQIVKAAQRCALQKYGSVVIQSGERNDERFIESIVEAVRRVKQETRTETLPRGLGVTLSLGEQLPETYQRLFEAGAHRYLLRIETSNPTLFARIHPVAQTFRSRLACLRTLHEIGFQVGTGVMIGLPGQTLEDLANDIEFFKEQDVAMIGMGPYIPNETTPLGREPCPDIPTRIRLSLLMIAATRMVLRDVNIAATTALQALDPVGREKGLRFGANVLMPQVTPIEVRREYQLYPGKPCLDEDSSTCRACLERRIHGVGRVIGLDSWGDSAHALK
jgi:biotin synthase